MTENEIASHVVDAAFKVHSRLGPGLTETVYEVVLAHELTQRKLKVVRQVPVSIKYEGIQFDAAFLADIIVENKVILELKAVDAIHDKHKKQLLTYLKLTGLHLGLLINFDEYLIKDGIHRVVNNLPE